jgi:hypothetical protein
MIKIQTYTLINNILTNKILNGYINKFWNDIFNHLHSSNPNIHLMLMCKVEFNKPELGYRTLAHLRKVNFSDKDLFYQYLNSRLGLLTEAYTVHPISKIVFTYIVKEGIADGNRLLLQNPKYELSIHNFNSMNLPLTMDPNKYGEIIGEFNINEGTSNRYIIENNNTIFAIEVDNSLQTNKVVIKGQSDLQWVDTKISDDTFKREIGKDILYIKDGDVIVKSKQLNTKAFKNLKKENKMDSKNSFMTMDIETINIDGKITPYLITAYTGKEYIVNYTNESLDQNTLFSSFISKLLDNISIGKTFYVYAHNLSGFDGILLLKHLVNYPRAQVEPLMFNGKLISFKFIYSEGIGKDRRVKTIIFKDSYLMLPLGLRRLCKAFDINQDKGHFPFLLSDVFYKGVLPTLEYWINLSEADYSLLYKKYTGIEWSFKDEAIKYCKLDCKCLFDILLKFNELIFKEFSVNIHKTLTLPALAMRIYKTLYMPKDTIYQLVGKVDSDIRESYTGGAVDVYIPHNGQNGDFFSLIKDILYYYDINSLYPFVMASSKLPVGKPIAFEGDIRSVISDAYGFFYCKITSPDNLNIPPLQRRIKTKDGVRTIAGLGSWTGWIYSEEMDNAIRLGYKFEILRGYQFEKANIFSDFVLHMYNLRLEYDRSHPMNLIAKLLMNSLYGKFGMKPESTRVDIYDLTNPLIVSELENMLKASGESISDYIKIDNHLILVRDNISLTKYNEHDDMYHGLDVNIAIASAITGGARVKMSLIKSNPNYTIYYSDTDSVVLNKKFPHAIVGDRIGQFKLEHEISRAVFLAPKVYGFITTDGKEIIKVKGLTQDALKDIHVSDLEKLLIKDSSLDFTQTKWNKNIFKGDISVSEVAYNLKATSNKRSPIYYNSVYSGTEPYNYSDIEDK